MKESILELRKKAEDELIALFGVKPKDITEEKIMYMIGLYNMDIDTMELAVSMMQKEWGAIYPTTPNEDIDETEEEKAKRRWQKLSK